MSELAMGAEALLALGNGSPYPQPLSHPMVEGGQRSGEGSRADRFSNRSLGHSKIKRDGLKAGTPAPDFRLPRLDGHGDLTLSELRGRRVLVVFSSPSCGPCNTLAPELENFHRNSVGGAASPSPGGQSDARPTFGSDGGGRGEGEFAPSLHIVMISKGEPKENRAKV